MSFYAELPLSELTDLVSRNPEEIDLRLALIEYYARHEEYEDALVHACMAEDLAGDIPDVIAWKALCMIHTGQTERGHSELQRVVRNNPCCDFQLRLVTEIVPLFMGPDDESPAGLIGAINQIEDDNAPAEFVERTNSFAHAVTVLHDELDEGVDALQDHVATWPSDLNAKLYLAIIYTQVAQMDEAKRLYRQIIQQDPQCSTALFDLATLTTDTEEAVRLTRQGLEICPTATHARYNLGTFLIQAGDHELGRNELKRIPADSDNYAEGLLAMAISFEEQGNLPMAGEWLEKSSILLPSRGDIAAKYGQLLCDIGEEEMALEQLDRAIQLNFNQHCVWANKALIHLRRNEFEQALVALQTAYERNPNSEDTAINLAVLLADTDQVEEAIVILESSIKVHPENPVICQNLGAMYCDQGNLDEALRYTELAIKLGIDSPSIYWNLANIHCLKDEREKCIQNLAKAIDGDTDYATKFGMDPDFRKFHDDPEFVSLCTSNKNR